MLKYTPDQTLHCEYDTLEKAIRFKKKLDKAFEEYDESFERKDFYRLINEGYRLLNRYLNEQSIDLD